MLLYNARDKNQGFTLIETLTIVVIIGILSAIAVPSFLSLFNRSKVDDGLNQVRGALQEAQREAIRSSKSCTVTLNKALRTVTAPCLVTGTRTLPDGVAMETNLSVSNLSNVTFSLRGNVTNTMGTIVVYMADNSTPKKGCFAISNGPGIIRSGIYDGSTTDPIVATACKKLL